MDDNTPTKAELLFKMHEIIKSDFEDSGDYIIEYCGKTQKYDSKHKAKRAISNIVHKAYHSVFLISRIYYGGSNAYSKNYEKIEDYFKQNIKIYSIKEYEEKQKKNKK